MISLVVSHTNQTEQCRQMCLRQIKDTKYIRKERYSGSCSRSFYVGDAVTQDDVKAKFENGVLTLEVPKKEEAPKVEEKKYISIEG